MSDYTFKRPNGKTITCWGNAKECIEGMAGMYIAFDYSTTKRWGILDVEKSKDNKQPYFIDIDYENREEAIKGKERYPFYTVVKAMKNWEGAEYWEETMDWAGWTEEEWNNKPMTWLSICQFFIRWEEEKIKKGLPSPLITEISAC
tara:strand:- start:60 stop:497 length:438 start_codon:yes stop_codon:yes gene_type:complete